MRRQCHFGKVNSSLCSSVDTGAAATLCYAIYGTWSDDCHTSYDTNAFNPPDHHFLSAEICDLRMHPSTSVGFS